MCVCTHVYTCDTTPATGYLRIENAMSISARYTDIYFPYDIHDPVAPAWATSTLTCLGWASVLALLRAAAVERWCSSLYNGLSITIPSHIHDNGEMVLLIYRDLSITILSHIHDHKDGTPHCITTCQLLPYRIYMTIKRCYSSLHKDTSITVPSQHAQRKLGQRR